MLAIIVFFIFFVNHSKADFPCDLQKIKSSCLNEALPPLILSGGSHGNKDCESDGFIHLEEANQGFLLVGLEGLIFDHTLPDNLFAKGIESPISYGFGAAYFYYYSFFVENTRHQVLKDFVKILKSNPFLSGEWEIFFKDYAIKNKLNFKKYQLLVTINKTLFDRIEVDDSIYFLKKIKAISILPFKTIVRDFIFHLIHSIKNKYTGNNLIIDNVIQFPNPTLSTSNFDTILLDARNYDMGKNIENLYCEAILLNKPLFIIVGSAHVPGLEKILKNSSQDQINIITRSSENAYQLYKKFLENDKVELEKISFLEDLKNQYLGCVSCYKQFSSLIEKLKN